MTLADLDANANLVNVVAVTDVGSRKVLNGIPCRKSPFHFVLVGNPVIPLP